MNYISQQHHQNHHHVQNHVHHPPQTAPVMINLTENDDNSDDTNTTQIDYLSSDKQFVVIHFLLECAKKLEAESVTRCTAANIFHKFFSSASMSQYDPYLIAATCLYLAGKTEDDHLKLRDVINVVHSVLHKTLEPLPLGDQYWNMRDAIVQTELLVLRMCQFGVKFTHPHKYLLHYLKSLKDWISADVWSKYPIAKTSWSMLHDLYHDPMVLSSDPSTVAISCIQLALETFGIQIPFVGSDSWFKVVDDKVSKDKIWEVMTRIMEVYNKETEMLDSLSHKY